MTLHLISHTHWDREWYRTFQQFRLNLVQLIDGLLTLLESDPEYRYFMLDGQTIVLEDYLTIRPEREMDLRRWIQSGRLIIGPWHILPDEFLVSPEALIRNLLEGERVAQRFGAKMMVGYIPDPFGHIGQMPQILKGFGIDAACLWRGVGDMPCECWWQAPDESQVLLAHLRESYGNAASAPTDEPERFLAEMGRLKEMLAPHSLTGQLLLMHGTDHMAPQAGTAASVVYAQRELKGETLRHSSLPLAIAAIQEAIAASTTALPVLKGELRSSMRAPLLPNVLSARMWIKQRNHACQTLLEKWAEPFSAWASLIDNPVRPRLSKPADFVRYAWRLLLECHPHDSICGCSIDQVHDEMRPRFDQVDQLGEDLTRLSLETLVEAVDCTPPVQPEQTSVGNLRALSAIVVFNALEQTRSDMVSVEIQLPLHIQTFEIIDSEGSVVPHQSKGVEGRDLINFVMSRQELTNMIGMVHDGRAAGMTVQAYTTKRDGDLGQLDIIMAEGGQPNLEAWEQAMVEVDAMLADPTITRYKVHGRSAPATAIQFVATGVPGMGYRTFWVQGQPASPSQPAKTIHPLARAFMPLASRLAQSKVGGELLSRLAAQPNPKPPFVIENEFLRVEASASDGTLTVTDKRANASNGQRVSFSGLNRFEDGGDCGDEYNFCPPEKDKLTSARLKAVQIEQGPALQVMTITYELLTPEALASDRRSRSSQMVSLPIQSQVKLVNGVERVDIHTEVENTARDHRLRVHFPAPFNIKTADYDGHFEVVRRPVDLPAYDETWVETPRPEQPQRAFVDLTNPDGASTYGLMVANRGLPEVTVRASRDGSEAALTLLRCVGWLSRDDLTTRKGHAGPEMPTPGAQMPGRHQFDYAIIPHGGTWHTTHHEAHAFNLPLRAVGTDLHAGSLPAQLAFVTMTTPLETPSTVEISSIKASEDQTGWILRGVNLSEQPTQVKLTPWKRFSSAMKVRLDEKGGAPLPIEEDGSVRLPIKAHEIFSVKFSQA